MDYSVKGSMAGVFVVLKVERHSPTALIGLRENCR